MGTHLGVRGKLFIINPRYQAQSETVPECMVTPWQVAQHLKAQFPHLTKDYCDTQPSSRAGIKMQMLRMDFRTRGWRRGGWGYGSELRHPCPV